MLLASAAWCAQAQDTPPESFGTTLAREHPVECLQRLTPVLVTDVVQRDLIGWLDGIGEGRKLPPGWKAGEPHYDAAFDLALNRLLADQEKNGPYAKIDMRDRFARAFDRANEAERRQAASFLATPEGRFAWTYIVDDATCDGIIGSLTRRKTALVDAHYQLVDDLQKGLNQRRAIHDRQLRTFTSAQQQSISRNSNLILGLFMKDDPAEKGPSNRFGIDGLVIVQRLGRDLGGTLPRIIALADEFAAGAKR
ncbi:MAG TPA: hypothetical protein VM146_04060 [Steroidobacteraceae bacterium]|nr:hypothetical protein [Steroidobacteraceae bacterium]